VIVSAPENPATRSAVKGSVWDVKCGRRHNVATVEQSDATVMPCASRHSVRWTALPVVANSPELSSISTSKTSAALLSTTSTGWLRVCPVVTGSEMNMRWTPDGSVQPAVYMRCGTMALMRSESTRSAPSCSHDEDNPSGISIVPWTNTPGSPPPVVSGPVVLSEIADPPALADSVPPPSAAVSSDPPHPRLSASTHPQLDRPPRTIDFSLAPRVPVTAKRFDNSR